MRMADTLKKMARHGCQAGRDYLSTWSRHLYVFGYSCHEFFHLYDKNGGCRAANFRHRGQLQTGTVPKKLSCKPGLRVMFCWAGSAWACGAVPWLGAAEAALSGLTIFYLCFSSLLFLRSRPRRQRSDQVRRRKTSTHVHS